MKITAERVTGHVFVVAVDEAEALQAFEDGTTCGREADAVKHERYRNSYDRHHFGDVPNTYKIVCQRGEDALN
ncbi:hypothetical protein [Streptomyces sp. NRRL S-1448]|uniref:hypothetical protein n=1 Tax=Streptomyces sp. NRRL S-1448 TaxID=1463883 RepID=UPI0004C29ED5|nr:hypothetical protein [Streptomyces sp. NRRL S-1448]